MKNFTQLFKKTSSTIAITIFLLSFFGLNAQTGYIYVHSKMLNEAGSPDVAYSVSGGSTSVPNFTLNDDPTQTTIRDMGASQDGRIWAVSFANGLYYRDAQTTNWVNTGITDVFRVDGGPTNTCFYISTAGTVFSYNGTSTQISTAGQFSSSFADIGSGWTTTPYVANNDANIYKYSGAGTTWNTYTTIGTNFLYEIDVNPTNGNVYIAGNNNAGTARFIWEVTPALTVTSLGNPVTGYNGFRDIAVNQNGEVYMTAYNSAAPNGWYVHKFVSGTTWNKELSSFDGNAITGGLGNSLWLTMNSGGWSNGSGWTPTAGPYPFYNIFARGFDGTTATYIDDERVRTSPAAGNSEFISVAPGTYTITETVPGGWDLQKILIYDPTSNSSSNQVAGTATITVAANEVVNVVFQTGELNPIAMTNDCSAAYLETFGVGTSVGGASTLGSFGAPVGGQTSYHYLTGNAPGEDGYYKIVNRANPDFNTWGGAAGIVDHTPGDGALGYMYAVNAGYDKGEFFRRQFTGVIPGASYNFSAWIIDLTASATVNPNVSFSVYDHTTQALLGTYNTGDLTSTVEPDSWQQYGFSFVATAADIDLVIGNNGFGGNGNDLALDDISFALIPSGTPVTTVAHSNCGALGSITVISPLGASFEYSIDGFTTFQTFPNTTFNNLAPGIYTISARFTGTTGCVVSKIDTVKGSICGNVFNDVNGLTDNTVNGSGTNAGVPLMAIIYDNTTGKVVDTAYVTASGTYTVHAFLGDNYTVYLTTTPATIGQTSKPLVTVPFGWVNTGENLGSGVGNDGTINGILPIGIVSASVTNANFGIEERPITVDDQSLNNITGTAVTVNLLTNDSDPSGGTIIPTTVSLSVPSGATNIVTDAQGEVLAMKIPDEGTWTVDPVTGAITFTPQVGFNGNPTNQYYTVKDNAGVESFGAQVIITYEAPITIKGTVINDLNANTLLDGAETGTNAGTNLYVYLVNAAGIVVDSAKVLSNGTYTLDAGQNLNYTIELSTIQYPVGTNTVTTPISTTAPFGWKTTGENGDGNTGFGDGTKDGMLSLTTGTTNVTQQNFAINQPLALGGFTWIDANNNGIRDNISELFYTTGTTVNLYLDANNDNVADGPAIATAISDINGAYGFGHLAPNNYIVGVVIPAGYTISAINGGDPDNNIHNDNNGIIVINGEVRSDAITLSVDGEPTKIGPTGGNINFTLDFGIVPIVQISGTVFNDANANTVINSGENGTTAGTNVYVYLVNAAGIAVDSAKVLPNGTYTLDGVGGSTYTIELSTTQYPVGTNTATTPIVNTLPTGWVTTGENGTNNTGAGDSTPDGVLTVVAGIVNITNQNFGIQQPPIAIADQSLNNVTGATVTINPLTNDTDAAPGTLDPTTVSLVVPTDATGVVPDAHGDVTSMTIPGQGTWTVNPVTGLIIFTPQVGFNGNPTVQQYNVEDNAGTVSNNANLTITYIAPITITGTVIDDLNGNTLIDGTETGTTAGTNLYVYLVNASNIVVDFAQVLQNGTYTLDGGQNAAYTIELSTTQYPIGTNISTTPIVNTPPSGWVITGENGAGNIGTGDGTPDGILSVTTGTVNVMQQNFGIQQNPPTTDSETSTGNPAGTNLTLDLLTGDLLSDGSQATPALVTVKFIAPAGGTVSGNTVTVPGEGVWTYVPATGMITFDPAPGFGGNPTPLTYTITETSTGLTSNISSERITYTGVLPVDLISFIGKQLEENINLTWKVANEMNFSHFEILRSNNAIEFASIGSVGSDNKTFYNYSDSQPLEGLNYYQLKMVDLDGKVTLSKAISINFEKGGSYVSVQNPAINGEFNVLTNLKSAKFSLVSSLGVIVPAAITNTGGNSIQIRVMVPISGIYYLRIESNGKYQTKKVIIP